MSRIEHVAIFADNLERLKAFYMDVFGMNILVDNHKAPVPGYFLSDPKGAVIEIIERPGGVVASDTRYIMHIAFFVEDFDAMKAGIEARGIRFETDTAVESENMRTAFFNDPEGNRCQIVWRPRPLGQ